MRKGFTLIELLAVIVILAIIALITIPAVLRMTDNAKVSSYRRSIDLYGRAINTAIAAYKSDKIEKKEPYQVTFSNVEAYVDYEGNDINCKESKIYSDDTILLTECNVEGNLVYAEKEKGYGPNNYYYYTNSKKRIRVLEYVDQVNKALKGKEFTGNTCQVQSNGNLVCNGVQIETTSNLEKPISGTLTINNNEVISYSQLKFEDKKVETVEEIPTVIDEGEINTGNNQNNSGNNNQGNNNTPAPQETIASETEDYRGYYADVDGDGAVDGVIYADLAHSKRGSWKNDEFGVYSYGSSDNLKKYVISQNKYKYNEGFGTNKIITVKTSSTGNKRFYVLALENFTQASYTTFKWYSESFDISLGVGKMSTYATDTSIVFGTGKENTRKMIEIWNKNGVGEGSYSGATQDDQDIWKYVQRKYQEGWYIPSREEWAAFADYLANKQDNPLTDDCSTWQCVGNGNYDDIYGLSDWYWSSSHYSDESAWCATFNNGDIFYSIVSNTVNVRLGYTF